MICLLTTKNGKANWCDRHRMQHDGHYANYAIDPGEKGERFRKLWDRISGGNHVKPSEKKLLRSLPIAKQCRHLGPVIKETKGCGGCTTYQCAKLGETKLSYCTGECKQWAGREAPAIIIPTRKPIRFDHKNLAPRTGGVRLNPSIIQSGNGYIFAYRNKWGNADISLIRLNGSFEPVGEPRQLNLSHPRASKGREDPRLFRHKGQLHISYIGWNGRRGKQYTKATVLFARINESTFEVEDKFNPAIPGVGKWNKNNSYFDYENETYCVFDIVPHRVLRVYCNTVVESFQTPIQVNWRYGYLRGGASPIRVGDEYIHFFHGMDDSGQHRLYSMGVYTFEAKPPFRITRISHEPLEVAGARSWGARVLFPCGAMLVNGTYVVSVGVHDEWSELRFYSEKQVEAAMRPV